MAEVEDKLVLRMEASLNRFEKQMAAARKAARTSSLDMEQRFDAMGKRMAASAERGAAGLSKVVNVSSAGRFVLQNTAAQLGDIAVQLEMGTNPARVMSQQLPQILGGFGALGGMLGVVAPLLGTVAAVGIPVAAMLLQTGGNAEKAGEKVKDFADKLSEAEAALGRAESAMKMASAGGLDDLLEKYGEVTDAVRELALELAQIEIDAAKVKVGAVIDDALGADFKKQIGELFGGVGEAIVSVKPEDIEAAKAAVREIQTEIDNLRTNQQAVPSQYLDELKLREEELAALEGRFAEAQGLLSQMRLSPQLAQDIAAVEAELRAAVDASDFTAVADRLKEVLELLRASGEELDAGAVKKLKLAEGEAREMAETLRKADRAAQEITVTAGQIGGALQSGVSAAAALAVNLGISLDTARRLAALGPQGINLNPDPTGRTYSGRGGDPRQQGGSALDIQTAKAGEFLANYKTPKASGGGRKSGASKTATDFLETGRQQVENLQRQIEMIGKTDAEIAGLTAKYRALDAAKKAGVDVDKTLATSGQTLRHEIEAQAASVEALTAEYDAAQLAHADFQRGIDNIADAMADAIVSGENLADSLRRVFQQIARDLISSGIKSLLMETFGFGGSKTGGGGGIIFNLAKGIFGGFRAEGGPVQAGRTYITGEEGPELFTPTTSGFITPNHALQGKGAGPMSINVNVAGARGNSEIEAMVASGVQQGLSAYDRALPARVGKITKDPRQRGR